MIDLFRTCSSSGCDIEWLLLSIIVLCTYYIRWYNSKLSPLHDDDPYQAGYWLTTSIKKEKEKHVICFSTAWVLQSWPCLLSFQMFLRGLILPKTQRLVQSCTSNSPHLYSATENSLFVLQLVPRSPAELRLPQPLLDKQARGQRGSPWQIGQRPERPGQQPKHSGGMMRNHTYITLPTTVSMKGFRMPQDP